MSEREERALWKVEQAGYHVRKQAGGYLLTTSENISKLDDVMQLAAFADAIDADHWIKYAITLSA